MADVKIVDIDNVQWNMKDQEARNRIAELEQKPIIKVTNKINKQDIKMDLIEIDNEKFINLRIWGYKWSGKIEERIASFTQDMGLTETTGCLMLGSRVDRTGRIVIHIDITTYGDLLIFPCTENKYIGNYSECNIYGNAFIKI